MLQSFLTRARNRLATERDLWRWRRQLAPMRADAPTAAPRRTVLFCELFVMPATAKMEAVMAGLLKIKGYRPIVLLEKPDRPVEQIFLSSVPETEFVYLSDHINVADRDAAERQAEAIMAATPNLNGLIDLEIDGFRIGRNAMSIVLRHFRLGRLIEGDAAQRAEVRKTLAQSLAAKTFAQRYMSEHRPDIAIFCERGYTPAGEIFDACTLTGVDTIQWCGAPQADCLLFRRYSPANRGEHPLTFSAATWQALRRMPWTQADARAVTGRIEAGYSSGTWCSKQQLQDGREIVEADHVRRTLALDPAKKTAVIFSHIFYDATFFYGENLFEDYERWLVEAVRCAIANPSLNWIVKVHPANVWRSRMDDAEMAQLEASAIQKHLGALPPHVKLLTADTTISTFSLFSVANYGVTVRGTIGLELPCFGIPVVTAGTGRYSGRGFTVDPATPEEFRAALARLHELPRLDEEAIHRARLLYYATFSMMPMPMRSVVFDFFAKPVKNGVFMPDVLLPQAADRHLLDTNDMGRVIRWMTETKLPELLTVDIEQARAA